MKKTDGKVLLRENVILVFEGKQYNIRALKIKEIAGFTYIYPEC